MSRPVLSRRGFLGLAGATTGAAVAGLAAWRALVEDGVQRGSTTPPTSSAPSVGSPGSSQPGGRAGRTLVVVQLGGGNDGLNTLVPAGDGRYHDLRPALALPEDEVLALPTETRFALHPALAPLLPSWQAGRIAAVAGVGFPGQSRSHFQAMDTWWSGRAGASTTGWLGRWLDATGTDDNPLRAVALGSGSPALVGERSVATVVLDPEGFALRAPKGVSTEQLVEAFVATAEPQADDPVVAAAQRALPSAFGAVTRFDQAALGGTSVDGDGGDDVAADRDVGGKRTTEISDLLTVAAGLLAQPIDVQVLTVGVTGFDTHARQDATHAALLADLASGLTTFLDQVASHRRAEDVLVLTTSEFGRRAADNGSGTDHGNAGTQFLVGAPVRGGRIVGDVELAALEGGDVPLSVDTGSLYAECLDWLGGPTDEVLDRRYERLGLVEA
jgi:uncharacterized protein (DUF1501 family)